MRLLLDTQMFLWYVAADPRLPAPYRAVIQDPENTVYLSVVSVWEAVIKHALGKLPLPEPPAEYLPRLRRLHGIESLSVGEHEFTALAALPSIHRDPFDRLLVAQAVHHDLTIVTSDDEVKAYPVRFLTR
ncbi:MAG TPA: type II toxin-antitoxin system VapC family toxin [Humisphaera sp.]